MNQNYFYSLDTYLKETFGEKVYRISLNGGMTCPNRDGTKGTRGCIFCSRGGSGDFAENHLLSVSEQIASGQKKLAAKTKCRKFIAYFQAYTNTYAPVSYLRPLFLEAIRHPDIVVLSIATRPDCINDEILTLLSELNQIKPVWIEFGLQTIHEKTADFIRREFSLACYETAVTALHTCKIPVITHVILGLPGETKQDMLDTVNYVAHSTVSGASCSCFMYCLILIWQIIMNSIHFHSLRWKNTVILSQTVWNCFPLPMVVHRITGDGPRALLLAPRWSTDKKRVLNTIRKRLQERKTYQGSKFQS